MGDLTSANSVFTLQGDVVFTVPQQLQGYAADDAFLTDAVESGEFVMGVDGILSGGWVPNPTRITVNLQADSPSNDVFEQIKALETSLRTKVQLTGNILLPAIGRAYALVNGGLVSMPPMPNAAKILRPRPFVLIFQACLSAPTA